ncbi:bacteriocin immunity protein [Pseudomonas sp. GL-B-19]|nr:bacteriocin immunity protein [Pseudomonas sp. GL-B-19]
MQTDTDLIYYSDSDEDSTPEAIIEKVKTWLAAQSTTWKILVY